jgi:hypothetical protein
LKSLTLIGLPAFILDAKFAIVCGASVDLQALLQSPLQVPLHEEHPEHPEHEPLQVPLHEEHPEHPEHEPLQVPLHEEHPEHSVAHVSIQFAVHPLLQEPMQLFSQVAEQLKEQDVPQPVVQPLAHPPVQLKQPPLQFVPQDISTPSL